MAPCLDRKRISKEGMPIFIVALSGIRANFEVGMLYSIRCLPGFPDEIVKVGGKIADNGPPANSSSAGIASGPSISVSYTHLRAHET